MRLRTAPLPAAVALLVVSCGEGARLGRLPEDGGSPPGPGTCPIRSPAIAPTFASILPSLQPSCGAATSSCHGTGFPTGHVEFDTDNGRSVGDVYQALVNQVPANAPPGYFLVKPDDVAHSWLIEKVTKDKPGVSGYGTRMPLAAPDLCDATLETLENWINNNAAP